MEYPNFEEENLLWEKGYKYIVGLDEAGRGPLAGPVVAGAICFKNPKSQNPNPNQIINSKSQKKFGHWTLGFGIFEINDSKQLSQKKREELYNLITTDPNIEWGVGIVDEKIIDRINILEASKLAMLKAVEDLHCATDYLLLDGNFKIKSLILQKSIVKGDAKVISIAGASIIAKVTRDRIMQEYHKEYPQYGFDRHKGYPTEAHVKMLEQFGACPIHRKSFSPVSKFI